MYEIMGCLVSWVLRYKLHTLVVQIDARDDVAVVGISYKAKMYNTFNQSLTVVKHQSQFVNIVHKL